MLQQNTILHIYKATYIILSGVKVQIICNHNKHYPSSRAERNGGRSSSEVHPECHQPECLVQFLSEHQSICPSWQVCLFCQSSASEFLSWFLLHHHGILQQLCWLLRHFYHSVVQFPVADLGYEGGFVRSGALARPRIFCKPRLLSAKNHALLRSVELGVCLRFILAACSLEAVYTGKIAITVDAGKKNMTVSNGYNNTSSLWIIINKGPKGGSLAPLDPP